MENKQHKLNFILPSLPGYTILWKAVCLQLRLVLKTGVPDNVT